ncbi:MAG: hypothetical protein HXX08_11575 [Chloroflexi bacterium]|uniref:Uncharacterized protein n=1 Tax=Candidatus Chlorohelix allophototropha TaxID=3003348 RepID=A0A8T7M2J1_9CHLR|nr:hypothetical protein [Chloroflexota bacterium]WJW65879.1 hypothetical protein OZ401_001658 [Chloroflexota bacterium L227-S17]
MKKQLTEAQREQRRNAGRALAAKRGSEHMKAIARRGYEKALDSTDGMFHVLGGRAAQAAQNAYMIRAGFFPNQTLAQWGYR